MTHVPLTPRQRRWRRIGLFTKGTIAVVVIGMALVVGSAGLALPWVVAHPHKVQDFLSARMGRPVTIGSLTGDWTVVGPVFQLRDVQIERPGGRGQPFRIDSAELAIDFYASLKSGVSFSEFRLLGLDLAARLRELARGGQAHDADHCRLFRAAGFFYLRGGRCDLWHLSGHPRRADGSDRSATP